MCIVDTDSSSHTIAAYAKWNAPDAPQQTDLPEWPAGADSELANHFFGNLFGSHAEIMQERKHWYLELVGTRPEYRGRGAAGQLLRWGIRKADEDAVEAYLEASPEGKPVYEHFGFKEMDRLVVQLKEEMFGEKEFIECMMVRHPNKTEKSDFK
jgi:GNAT superfamily N-acetyltransferase